MSQYSYQQSMPQQESNGLAIAGFVCSLVGLFTAGLLSPVGLILSLVALGKPTGKGFAVAGLVLGLLGMCGWVLGFVIAGAAILAALGIAVAGAAFIALAEPERAQLTADMAITAAALEGYREHNDYLPASLSELDLGHAMLTDPWGNPYRYMLTDEPPGYELISNGMDGDPSTDDDIYFSKLDEYWEAAENVEFSFDGDDDGGIATITVGGREIKIVGTDEGGRVTVDTGEKVIEIKGDEAGGGVSVKPKPDAEAPPAKPGGEDAGASTGDAGAASGGDGSEAGASTGGG